MAAIEAASVVAAAPSNAALDGAAGSLWFLENMSTGLHLANSFSYERLVRDAAVWVFDGAGGLTHGDCAVAVARDGDALRVTTDANVALGAHRAGRVAKRPSSILAGSRPRRVRARRRRRRGVARMRRAVARRRERSPARPTTATAGTRAGSARRLYIGGAHPVVLAVAEAYLGEPLAHLRCLHAPVANTLLPAKALIGAAFGGQMRRSASRGRDEFREISTGETTKRRARRRWHCDYPYHEKFTERWPARPVSLQFNLCVDEFRSDNGATLYFPASHRRNRWPTELNRGATGSSDPMHANKRQFLAPAGSAVLYDSRTWHRRPDELNVSGEARVNVLLAFSHKWMRPMIPYGDEAANLRGGGALLGSLTRRERDCALLLFGGPDDGGDDDVGIEEAFVFVCAEVGYRVFDRSDRVAIFSAAFALDVAIVVVATLLFLLPFRRSRRRGSGRRTSFREGVAVEDEDIVAITVRRSLVGCGVYVASWAAVWSRFYFFSRRPGALFSGAYSLAAPFCVDHAWDGVEHHGIGDVLEHREARRA
ncbi:dioxygenase [Aureococcus anophagefferens]|nr:dioxygenase [Aureococcus anophagefferens]